MLTNDPAESVRDGEVTKSSLSSTLTDRCESRKLGSTHIDNHEFVPSGSAFSQVAIEDGMNAWIIPWRPDDGEQFWTPWTLPASSWDRFQPLWFARIWPSQSCALSPILCAIMAPLSFRTVALHSSWCSMKLSTLLQRIQHRVISETSWIPLRSSLLYYIVARYDPATSSEVFQPYSVLTWRRRDRSRRNDHGRRSSSRVPYSQTGQRTLWNTFRIAIAFQCCAFCDSAFWCPQGHRAHGRRCDADRTPPGTRKRAWAPQKSPSSAVSTVPVITHSTQRPSKTNNLQTETQTCTCCIYSCSIQSPSNGARPFHIWLAKTSCHRTIKLIVGKWSTPAKWDVKGRNRSSTSGAQLEWRGVMNINLVSAFVHLKVLVTLEALATYLADVSVGLH